MPINSDREELADVISLGIQRLQKILARRHTLPCLPTGKIDVFQIHTFIDKPMNTHKVQNSLAVNIWSGNVLNCFVGCFSDNSVEEPSNDENASDLDRKDLGDKISVGLNNR